MVDKLSETGDSVDMTATRQSWVPQTPPDSFGIRLRKVREALGLSLTKMCALCSEGRDEPYASATWSTWERGVRPHNWNQLALDVVAATGVDRDWLMWGDAPPEQPEGPTGWVPHAIRLRHNPPTTARIVPATTVPSGL